MCPGCALLFIRYNIITRLWSIYTAALWLRYTLHVHTRRFFTLIPFSVCHVRSRVKLKNIEKWRETGSLSASRRDVLTAYRVNILLRKCSCVQRSLTADIIDLKTGIRVYRVFKVPLIWFNRDCFYYKWLYKW